MLNMIQYENLLRLFRIFVMCSRISIMFNDPDINEQCQEKKKNEKRNPYDFKFVKSNIVFDISISSNFS